MKSATRRNETTILVPSYKKKLVNPNVFFMV